MATRKIIFFAIVGFILVALTFGIIAVMNMQEKNIISAEDLNIWITEGTTENYEALSEDFKKQYPDYKNLNINFEKKAADDADRYRTFILSSLSDEAGPDIFMIRSGEDAILENKISTIQEEYIDINAFENTFDSVFSDLIISSGDFLSPTKSLKWVPIGYETMGVFYNSALLRSGAPSTWTAVQNLYGTFPSNTYPTNIGLGPKFTPNAADVLTAFFVQDGVKSYKESADGSSALTRYLSYASMQGSNTQDENEDDFYTSQATIENTTSRLASEKQTTFDQFLQGQIGMIVGYPSLVKELEKSAKRVWWNNSANVIQSASLPSQSSSQIKNIASYPYFAIANTTNKPEAALAFLTYLTSDSAQRILMENFPYLLPAHKKYLDAKKWTRISEVLTNVKIDGFIPRIWEEFTVFNYGIQSEFKSIVSEKFASGDKSEISEILKEIDKKISCTLSVQIHQSDATCD